MLRHAVAAGALLGWPVVVRSQPAAQALVAYRAARPPAIDGSLDDAAWRDASWSAPFVDIEGARRPAPRHATRVTMAWDDRALYVAARLDEPDVWATITRRDAVIFHDNDFEVFLDPDGDARNYAELEVNALNTVWDLFLATPYRDGGRADDGWDLAGLRTAVRVHGTLNNPADVDSGWTVEIAVPWAALERATGTTRAPAPGARWRINFSRVQWRVDTVGGAYRKVEGVREDNWVWSAQGMVDMHQPERWGTVEFSPLRSDPRAIEAAVGPSAGPSVRPFVRPPARPFAQPRFGPPRVATLRLAGWAADVAGATLDYHSPHPEAQSALLARARREVQRVAWRTDTVPEAPRADTVEFVWIAGLAGSKGVHTFRLDMGGGRGLAFRSLQGAPSRDFVARGPDGTSLTFAHTLVDRFEDVFGTMTLRVPAALLAPGRPLELAVTGEDSASQDWYMTFRHQLAVRPRVVQNPVLIHTPAGPQAELRVIIDNLSGHDSVVVEVAGQATVRAALVSGANVIRVPAGPAAARDQRLEVRLDGTVALDTTLRLAPVARRDVYLLSYSHNDIGYSALQPEVERIQWRNIDSALALADRTQGYPGEARYRWNIEQLWPLDSWLRRADATQRARFAAAVRDGSIGLNGFYAGVLSGLATLPEMTHFFDFARQLRDSLGLPVTTGLISDIPGQSWGIVTALARSGIRWFAVAPNAFDRIGYTLETWGDRPFRWVSQDGRDTVLTWVAGASYSAFHMAPARIAGERTLFALMRRLDAMGYPYLPVQLPYTIHGDNGPTDPDLPDFVREWNARYASPRLLLATHDQLFRAFEARHGAAPPVVRGDFTGYWEDGAASTAREVALVRAASSRLTQAEALWAALAPGRLPRAEFTAAWRAVTLWDEHTWGAAASVETPDAPEVVAQWRYKQAFALAADSLSRDLVARALATRGPAVPDAFEVFNTSAWPRTELVLVPAALSRAGDGVVGPDGRAVPSQRLASGELAVLVRDVPAGGSTRYAVRRADARTRGRTGQGALARLRVGASGPMLETPQVLVRLDTITGAITSLIGRAAGAELVDAGARRGLGEYLYVAGTDSSRAVGVSRVRIRVGEPGGLVASVIVEADAPGARSVTREVRVVDGLDEVLITTTIDKLPVRTKEGVHLAFPFRVPGGQLRFDVAGAIVRPDSDQLAGSSRNHVSVMSWVDVSNDSLGVTWTAPDAPLVEIGGINAESPWMRSLPATQTFYAYLMNNYWHTNYKADQEGLVTFRNAIRPHGAFRPEEAIRFGAEQREPLLVAPAARR